jgi:2-keto-4-pentenoate hydratase/2-oxohepta-3-ene-1,7-dioic acid hydratase in catechol pathway
VTGKQRWVRFEHDGAVRFGTLEGDTITVHDGDMLAGNARATAHTIGLKSVRLLTPTTPTKMIALWNNFGALAKKLELSTPAHPLYLLKSPSSFLACGETIRQPKSYDGRVAFEAELGIVIGKTCKDVGEAEAATYIFGYTCVNDVTAIDVLHSDPSFPQWARAKSYDTFGVFGPVVATQVATDELTIKAVLDGEERQNYPASDMTMKPHALVSRLSRDMTLNPGDVIACGTSVGVGRMKPGSTIDVVIDGIGTLNNRFE